MMEGATRSPLYSLGEVACRRGFAEEAHTGFEHPCSEGVIRLPWRTRGAPTGHASACA
jgi:hypothetical protein